MTIARSFIDTNVLVYTDDFEAPGKRTRAMELLVRHEAAGSAVVSAQVLQEYFAAATRKLGVGAERAREKVALFARLDVVLMEPDDILSAIDIHRLHRIAFWDALIFRAARKAGCKVILSEDLQAGRSLDGLKVENPFL